MTAIFYFPKIRSSFQVFEEDQTNENIFSIVGCALAKRDEIFTLYSRKKINKRNLRCDIFDKNLEKRCSKKRHNRGITLRAIVARDFYTATANSENFDRCPVALITQIIRTSNSPCKWNFKYVSEVRSPQILKHRTLITFRYTVALSSYYLLFLAGLTSPS